MRLLLGLQHSTSIPNSLFLCSCGMNFNTEISPLDRIAGRPELQEDWEAGVSE